MAFAFLCLVVHLTFFLCSSGLDFRFWKMLLLVLCTVCFPPGERPVGWEGGWAGAAGWGPPLWTGWAEVRAGHPCG